MLKIFKFPLRMGECELGTRQDIILPRYSKFLHMDEQDGMIVLWYMVDLDKDRETESILIVGTGWELNDTMEDLSKSYLGSIQMKNGLVWHVFGEHYGRNGMT